MTRQKSQKIQVDSAQEADMDALDILSSDEHGVIAVSRNYSHNDLSQIAKAKRASRTDKAVPLADYRAEFGSTGLNIFGGRVNQEFLTELQGLKGYRIYEEMRKNDPVIGGLLFATEMAIRRVHWFAKGSDDESTTFLEECKDDMSMTWNDFISEVLTMLPFGWAWFEQVYKERRGRNALDRTMQTPIFGLTSNLTEDPPRSKYNDGRIGWRKFAYRPPDTLERWEMDKSGGILGMWQRDIYVMRAPVFLPLEKSILFRTRMERNNPEGSSVLRNSYRPWFFKKELEKFEAIALERTGAGIPVIKLPLGYTSKDLSTAKQVVRRIRVDEQMGITLPPGWELELMRTNGRAETQTYEMAIDRYSNHILMSLLLTFIALGTRSVGAFALVKAQQDFFKLALVGWVTNIADTINMYAVRTLFELNSGTFSQDIVNNPPQLQTTDIGEYDLDSIGQFIERAGKAGFLTPDDHAEDWLRRIVGFPPLDEPKDTELKRDDMREAAVGIQNNPFGGGGGGLLPPNGADKQQIKQSKKNAAIKKAAENDKRLRQKYREIILSGVSKTSETDLNEIRGLIEEVIDEMERAKNG